MAETFYAVMLRTFAELSEREVKALCVELQASCDVAEFVRMLDGRMDV